MEARFFSAALIAASALSLGATYPTRNFIITAATPELAREVGEAGEVYRRSLAQEWLGRELPPWQEPCPVTVQAAPHLGAGGATSFMFQNSRPFGWRMQIQGSRERILDSVLPHEVTHMIFATHFGRPLPRWADEGACTCVEHASEKAKQHQLLLTFLTTGRGIAFNKMFAMKEYPSDILPLYSQGYSLARYLIALGGKPKFVEYVGDGMKGNNWTAATKKHYGFESLSDLQITWLDWVRRGSPPVSPAATLIAHQDAPPATDTLAAGQVSPVAYERAAADPATSVAVATGSADGWYARQRDRAVATVGTAPPLAGNDPRAATSLPSGTRDLEPSSASVTRPQDIGVPVPTPLQWADSPSGSYLQPVPQPVKAAAVPLYDAVPPRRY
jgi:hypothetical protein